MKFWIKRMLRYTFGLVPYQRVDEVYSTMIQHHERYFNERKMLEEHIRVLTDINKFQSSALDGYRKGHRDLLLRVLVLETAPLECMTRALDILCGEVYSDRIARAKAELEHGLLLIQKNKNTGGVNANNGSAA